MGDTNFFSGIVKVLENPKELKFNGKIKATKFRAELPQIYNNKIIHVVFWGERINYYKINDYLLIEGYISTRIINKNLKKVEITVLKAYPVFLI